MYTRFRGYDKVGAEATKEILENEGYSWFGTYLFSPIYDNGKNKIVVRNEKVFMVYDTE